MVLKYSYRQLAGFHGPDRRFFRLTLLRFILIPGRRPGRAALRLLRLLLMSTMIGPVRFWRLVVLRRLTRGSRSAGLRQLLSIGWRVRGRDLHRRARLQFVLSVYHDLLAFLQTVVDQGLSSIDLSNLHRAHFCSFILFNHI